MRRGSHSITTTRPRAFSADAHPRKTPGSRWRIAFGQLHVTEKSMSAETAVTCWAVCFPSTWLIGVLGQQFPFRTQDVLYVFVATNRYSLSKCRGGACRFWLRDAASTAATLAEGISVRGDEYVEQLPCIAKGKLLSQYAYQPCGREQTGQTSDRISADMDFSFGSDHMQLPKAILHLEPGVYRG